MKLRAVAIASLLSIWAAACTEPLEFAEWTIPVAEGARIIEYAAVPLEERTERVELTQELVLGAGGGEYDSFYGNVLFDVDTDGNVYVLDGGNFRVLVFDANGNFVRTFGRRGEGPGEFANPMGFAFSGGRLVIEDMSLARFSAFDPRGQLLQEDHMEERLLFLQGYGLPDGDVIALKQAMVMNGVFMPGILVRISSTGSVVHEYAGAPATERKEADELDKRLLVAVSRTGFSVDPEGGISFTAAEEYQVLKFAAGGAMTWALRVAHHRIPYPQDLVDARLARARERRPDRAPSEYYVPEHQPALSSIATDGHGHLWVFPWVYPSGPDEDAGLRPVDIYASDGTRLFSGLIDDLIDGSFNTGWVHAQGDHVYTDELDAETGERIIVRYRLVEPFE